MVELDAAEEQWAGGKESVSALRSLTMAFLMAAFLPGFFTTSSSTPKRTERANLIQKSIRSSDRSESEHKGGD